MLIFVPFVADFLARLGFKSTSPSSSSSWSRRSCLTFLLLYVRLGGMEKDGQVKRRVAEKTGTMRVEIEGRQGEIGY